MEGRSLFPTTAIRMGCFASWSVEPCSSAGCPGCGAAHSAGPFSQEWTVTSRRTHGPPEDLLDDWGSCEFLSSFRQNATATFSVVLPERGGSGGAGLSAPRSVAAARLVGGGKLSFLALGLFSLAVLAPASDRLGAASHRDERNNQLDRVQAATQFFEPD